MNRASRLCVALACAAAVSIVLGNAPPAQACLFSNVASAYADGVLARRVTTLPDTARGEALWAPFAFRRDFAPGQVLHLREDMREVARSLGNGALHWRVRWLFGDGTRSTGVAVTHVYRRQGLYKIEVQSYYVGSRATPGWYDFDMIDVAVGTLPPGMTWMAGLSD